MARKMKRRKGLVIVGLALGLAGYLAWLPAGNAPATGSYDRVIRTYFQRGYDTTPSTYDVDVWALWQELGIKPDSLIEGRWMDLRAVWDKLRGQPAVIFSPGRYLFDARAGEVRTLECSFASSARTKVIAMTRDLSCTHILVFRPQEGKDGNLFRFAYHFTTGLDGCSDRSSIKLLEPEPGLELLEVTYRNNHGTGASGFA